MIKDLEHFLWLLVTCISYFKTFTISSLPVNEHGLSSDLLVSPLISLSKDLQSSVYRFFTSLVKFIPKNFIPFALISKLFSPCTLLHYFGYFFHCKSNCLLSFIFRTLLMYRNVSDFFLLYLYWIFFSLFFEIFRVFNIIRSGHLTKVIFSLPFRFQFLFISFSSLTYVERTSSTMLNIKVVFFGHAMWLVRSSFPHQGLNPCPWQAVKVQSLNRWTTRESLLFSFSFPLSLSWF